MLDGYRGRGDRALAVGRRLRGTRASDLSGFTALMVARALTLTEHHAEAREVFELMERSLDETLLWHPHIPLLRADLEIRAGNLHLAPDFIDTASRRRRPGMPFREDLHLLFEVWRLDEAGRDEEAEEVEQDLVRRASAAGDRGALAHLSAFQGAHLLARGRPAEAVSHLQRCDEVAPGDIDPAVIRHEPELIEALVGVGRREHAMLVLQRFRSRLNRFPSRWGEIAVQRCEALLADGEASLDLFRRMLRGWKAEDSDRERARVLAAFAQRLQDLGRPAEAADARTQARIHCERAGDRVRARALDDVPVAPAVAPRPAHPVLSQLTEEERTVIDLVREGLRNREIADRIYVSLRTVEIRLTRIYRRFGVRSRTELIAKLTGSAEAVAG
jgi:DNA-binding CsgD family transcriptional regulator